MTELSDELLVAYVDGQLAKDQSRAVEKVLKQDEITARRTAALQEAHERLEFAFDAILAGELNALLPPEEPEPLHRAEEDRWQKPVEHRNSMSTLFLVSLVFGVGGLGLGYLAQDYMRAPAPVETARQQSAPPANPDAGSTVAKDQSRVAAEAPAEAAPAAGMAAEERTAALPAPEPAPPPEPTWQEQVARAHALVSRDSLEVSLDSQKNPYLLSLQLTKAVGEELRGPDLRPDGYRFVRAQILRLGDKPLAQMLYMPETGQPLALYATRGGSDSDPVFKQEGSIGMVSWSQDGIDYVLAAEAGEDLLMRIAAKVQTEPLPELPEPPKDLASGSAAGPEGKLPEGLRGPDAGPLLNAPEDQGPIEGFDRQPSAPQGKGSGKEPGKEPGEASGKSSGKASGETPKEAPAESPTESPRGDASDRGGAGRKQSETVLPIPGAPIAEL